MTIDALGILSNVRSQVKDDDVNNNSTFISIHDVRNTKILDNIEIVNTSSLICYDKTRLNNHLKWHVVIVTKNTIPTIDLYIWDGDSMCTWFDLARSVRTVVTERVRSGDLQYIIVYRRYRDNDTFVPHHTRASETLNASII